MGWFSCPQILVKETSSRGFIRRGKLNNWPVWHIFMQCYNLIPCSIIPFFLFFPVYNLTRFVNSVYLYKKFIVMCHASLLITTDRANVISVVGDYIQFFLPFFPNRWIWGVLFVAGLQVLLGGVPCACFLLCISELKRKNILRSWFIDWDNMLNHLIIPRSQQNFTCFRYIWW